MLAFWRLRELRRSLCKRPLSAPTTQFNARNNYIRINSIVLQWTKVIWIDFNFISIVFFFNFIDTCWKINNLSSVSIISKPYRTNKLLLFISILMNIIQLWSYIGPVLVIYVFFLPFLHTQGSRNSQTRNHFSNFFSIIPSRVSIIFQLSVSGFRF